MNPMNHRIAPHGASLLAGLLLLCAVGPVASQACGDCDGSGGVTILDALAAAQMGIGLRAPLPSIGWACDVNDNGHISIVDALLMALAASGTGPALVCPADRARFSYALFSVQDLRIPERVFSDSYDSSAGYTPASATPPFTTPFERDSGGIGSNGYLWLANAANELHGALEYGNSRWASVGGAQAQPTTELIWPVQVAPVDPVALADAMLTNDNALINGEATLDAAEYMPGQGAYDPVSGALDARGADTTVRLGSATMAPRVYYFTSMTASLGATILFVGPAIVYLEGDLMLDPTDGVQNLLHPGVVPDAQILCSSQASLVQLDGPLAVLLYAPESMVLLQNPVEIFGALVVGSIDPTSPGTLTLHYDVQLGFDYP